MANNSLKITELPQTQNVGATDLVLVVYNANGNASIASGLTSTRTITVDNLKNSFRLSGPFANNSVANVAIGQLYYDTTGTVKVKLN